MMLKWLEKREVLYSVPEFRAYYPFEYCEGRKRKEMSQPSRMDKGKALWTMEAVVPGTVQAHSRPSDVFTS